MARKIWSGKGELQQDEAYWMIGRGYRVGMLVGRDYVRRRVASHLAKYMRREPVSERAELMRQTVDNDEWLASRNGCTVQSICWDAWNHYYTHGFDMMKGK